MNCPLCDTAFTQQQAGLFACPNGHGTLISGSYLSDIETAVLASEKTYLKQENSLHTIVCPHCHAAMHKVDYNSTGIIIDACTHCHHRWLDGDEISKIKQFKPRITGPDLLAVQSLDQKLKQRHAQTPGDLNPDLPFETTTKAGGEAAVGMSGYQNMRGGIILQRGLLAIYKGMTHTKLSRIFTAAVLLIFGLLFYLVVLDAKNTFSR